MISAEQRRRVEAESYSLRNMYLSVLVVKLVYVPVGIILVWTSPMLPYLKALLHTTTSQDVAIVSSLPLGMTVGPAIGGLLITRFGYKSVLCLHGGLCVVSVSFLAFPTSVSSVCVGRLVAGVAVATVLYHMPAYVTEIADPEVCAVLSPVSLVTQALGYYLVYTLGPHLDYYQLLSLYLPVPVLSLICLAWLPESPHHHIAAGCTEQAKQTVTFLRRGISTRAVDLIVQHIQEQVARRQSQACDWSTLLATRVNTRAWHITLALVCLVQLSGFPVMFPLTQTLLIKSESELSVTTAVSAVGVAVFHVSALALVLLRHCGHTRLVITSLVAMSLSMLVLGLYFLNLESGKDVSTLSWVPLTCILLYVSAFQMGLANNIDAIINALFSPQFKVLGSISTATVSHFFMFLVCSLYFPLSELLSVSAVLWMFAGCCVLAALFVSLCVPETSSMSPSDVQDFLEGPWLTGSFCYRPFSR